MRAKISMILAMDSNGAVGKDNKLPWHIPNDLQHFKAYTMDKVVVMGRKTFESLSEPLPGRLNVVITHDRFFSHKGVLVFHSIKDFLLQCAKRCKQDIVVIGGASLYQQLVGYASEIMVTHVNGTYDADTFIDPLLLDGFVEVSRKAGVDPVHEHYYALYKRERFM